jgi:hypothetical protein
MAITDHDEPAERAASPTRWSSISRSEEHRKEFETVVASYSHDQVKQRLRYDHHAARIGARQGVLLTYHSPGQLS